jgi:ApaLI-like restriction endonuclease
MSLEAQIIELARSSAEDLQAKMVARRLEMAQDDLSHYLIYQVLGISQAEGQKIDEYQNTGRLLYNAAGRFLETATKLCFQSAFPEAKTQKIPNTRGLRPKTFEIDCLIDQQAIEIKWRDATTDGDHITKEHTRLQAVVDNGFVPVRLMFYAPNRTQAMQIQATLKTLYLGLGGQYCAGNQAWEFVQTQTGIDLKNILETIGAP